MADILPMGWRVGNKCSRVKGNGKKKQMTSFKCKFITCIIGCGEKLEKQSPSNIQQEIHRLCGWGYKTCF